MPLSSQSPPEANRLLKPAATGTQLWPAYLVVAITLFIADHDLNLSLNVDKPFSASAEGIVDAISAGDGFRRVALGSLALFGLIWLIRGRGERPVRIDATVAIAGLYLLWCGASYLWSIEPNMTVRRVGVLFFS